MPSDDTGEGASVEERTRIHAKCAGSPRASSPWRHAAQSVAAKGRAHQDVHEQVDDVQVQLDGGDDEVIDAHPVDDLVGVVNLRAVRERR